MIFTEHINNDKVHHVIDDNFKTGISIIVDKSRRVFIRVSDCYNFIESTRKLAAIAIRYGRLNNLIMDRETIEEIICDIYSEEEARSLSADQIVNTINKRTEKRVSVLHVAFILLILVDMGLLHTRLRNKQTFYTN